MPDIHELNKRLAEAEERLHVYGMMQTPSDPEQRLASSARYRLVYDAWSRAHADYVDAMQCLPTEELISLSKGSN
jgi:hypothetical protein